MAPHLRHHKQNNAQSPAVVVEPADPGRYSGRAAVPPSAAHTTPWPRPRQSRGLWPEARWSEGAAPPSRPCRTGTAAPELKHSDDPPHAPWFVSATPGPSVYPQPQPSGIPAGPFSRRPYDRPGAIASGGAPDSGGRASETGGTGTRTSTGARGSTAETGAESWLGAIAA